MKRIILTGGGTAGHVTPNIALVPKLKEKGYDIQYIGSYDGIERKLIEDLKIPYYGIASGKLRRYFDIKNFSDPFRVVKGYGQAVQLMKKLKPSVVFSKGGFVAVPVVMVSMAHGGTCAVAAAAGTSAASLTCLFIPYHNTDHCPYNHSQYDQNNEC